MSYGVRIWGADGTLQFNTDTSTWRIVLTTVVSFEGAQERLSQQFSAPGCNAGNAVSLVLPIGPSSDADRQLETEMSDGAVFVRNYVSGYSGSNFSRSAMRLIVMRWH